MINLPWLEQSILIFGTCTTSTTSIHTSTIVYQYTAAVLNLVLNFALVHVRKIVAQRNHGALAFCSSTLQWAIAIVKWPIMVAMQRTNQRRSVRTVFGSNKAPPTQCMPSVTTSSQSSRLAPKKIFFFASLLSVYPFKKLVQVLTKNWRRRSDTSRNA